MAAKNKINSLNLIGFVKRFPKGYTPQRNATSCSRLKKRPQTKEPDYTKLLSKDSAIYVLRGEEKTTNRSSCDRRRVEIEQSQVQLRKCNKMLKDHYLQRRDHGLKVSRTNAAQTGHTKPTEETVSLSKKLKAIMALNISLKPTETTLLDDIKQCRGFECNLHQNDYEPETAALMNRWRMRIPTQKLQNLIDMESAEPNMSPIRKKSKTAQSALAPKVVSSKEIQAERLLGRNLLRHKYKNMWQIGARYIPRLN